MSELLRQPKTEALARFLRAENVFAGQATPNGDGTSTIDLAGHAVTAAGSHEGDVRFMVRPERVHIVAADAAPESAIVSQLYSISDRGPYRRLVFARPVRIVAYAPASDGDVRITEGLDYGIVFPPDAVHVLG